MHLSYIRKLLENTAIDIKNYIHNVMPKEKITDDEMEKLLERIEDEFCFLLRKNLR